MSAFGSRCLDAAVGLMIARVVPEPADDHHPVAWFGRAMHRFEELVWRDDRRAGVVHAAVGTALGAIAGRAVPTSVAVAVTTAGPALRHAAAQVADALGDDDLQRARALLPALVGRDPSDLDASQVAAAAIESVAENAVDAVVAPVLWAMVLGGAGAGAHRAVNTMDAMVGHRSVRHEQYGWASARLDDVMNLVPARVFAVLVARRAGRPGREVLSRSRVASRPHPSPNAGLAEAAVAEALEVRLGGPLRYGARHEDRPVLGSGSRPEVGDITRACALVDGVERDLVVVLLTCWLLDLVWSPR